MAHGSHTGPPHAHACADGIDALIVRYYCNFSADTRVTGSCLDLQQTLLDFRHFVLEQLANEFGGRARKDDLLTTGCVVNARHPGTNAVTHANVLTRNHLGTRQAAFDLAGINDGVALVHTLDRA